MKGVDLGRKMGLGQVPSFVYFGSRSYSWLSQPACLQVQLGELQLRIFCDILCNTEQQL